MWIGTGTNCFCPIFGSEPDTVNRGIEAEDEKVCLAYR